MSSQVFREDSQFLMPLRFLFEERRYYCNLNNLDQDTYFRTRRLSQKISLEREYKYSLKLIQHQVNTVRGQKNWLRLDQFDRGRGQGAPMHPCQPDCHSQGC